MISNNSNTVSVDEDDESLNFMSRDSNDFLGYSQFEDGDNANLY